VSPKLLSETPLGGKLNAPSGAAFEPLHGQASYLEN